MKYQLHVIDRLFGKAELNNLTKTEENCGISREIAAQSQNFNPISLVEGFGMRVFAEARLSKRTDCELQTMGKKKNKTKKAIMNLALKSQGFNIHIHCWHFPALKEKSSLMAH